MKEKNYNSKKRFLTKYYSYYRIKYARYLDDRRLFCNTYDLLSEALEEMRNLNSILLSCAFNDIFRKETELMDRIIHRFENQTTE